MSDLEFKIKLEKAKTSGDPIYALSRVALELLADIKTGGPERMRYWVKQLYSIHKMLDDYLEGQFLTSEISDVMGEHIFLTEGNTSNVDFRDYFSDTSTLQPYPVRSSIRHKIPEDMMKMMEDGFIGVNKQQAKTMSVFFKNEDTEKWLVTHTLAHESYNAPDAFGLKLKREIQPKLFLDLQKNIKEKEKLIDMSQPVKERAIVEDMFMETTVEGKPMVTDLYLNKMVVAPKYIDNGSLEPKEIE